MNKLKNYIMVPKNMFNQLRPGDYIRWPKVLDDKISSGAVIEQIGVYEKKKNWRLRGRNGTYFSLYWENIDYIYLKKHPLYSVLEEKINILTSTIAFIVKETGIENEFIKFDKHLKKVVHLRRTKSDKFNN